MNKIYVVADVSGSFAEMDKKYIQLLLLQTIVDLSKSIDYSQYEFEYYVWCDKIIQLSDFNFNVGGSAKLETLSAFIETLKKRNEEMKTHLCFVVVGADANFSTLKRITSKVYGSVDVIAAINEVCCGNNSVESLPNSLGDIVW